MDAPGASETTPQAATRAASRGGSPTPVHIRSPSHLAVYLALNLARTRVHGRRFWSLAGKTNGVSGIRGALRVLDLTRARVKSWTPVSLVVRGGQGQRVKGLEPSTFTLAT